LNAINEVGKEYGLNVISEQDQANDSVVELVGRSAPIGVSQLNTMPLDLRI